MTLRFSLRGLLILTAVLAAFCYWRSLPAQTAKRLAFALETGEYDPADPALTQIGGVSPPGKLVEGGALLLEQTPIDWLLGKQQLVVFGRYGEYSYSRELIATADGLEPAGSWSSNFSPAHKPKSY